jgi:arginyl-tRNA synthetase
MNPLPIQIAHLITQALEAAQTAADLQPFDIPALKIDNSKNPEQGDYAFPAMALAKPAKSNPRVVADAIVKHLPKSDLIASVEVAGPGFVNLTLSKNWIRDQVNVIIANGDTFGNLETGKGKTAQVEFLSANPTGPITIGRTRGAILGDGIARVLEAVGYDVTREYYFNNAGAQMRKLGESLRLRYLEVLGEDVTLPSGDDADFYQGDYLVTYAKDLMEEVGDSWKDEDWQPFKEYAEKRIFEWIKATLDRVNIQHDVFFNENTVYDNGAVDGVLKTLEEKDYIYESPFAEQADDDEKERLKDKEPALWFRSTAFDDNKDRVVKKASGEPTYTLPDIAYHIDKIDRGFDLLVNVLGADHLTEAAVVRRGLQAVGKRVDHLHVVIMQMVRLIKDGEEFRMSTRKGNYVTLDDLIDEVGADAVQYFLLQRSPDSQLTFDIDLALKQSNENPVFYIQYAHVRCAGIFREATARKFDDDGADLSLLDEEALDFIRKSLELLEVVDLAAQKLSPHSIAHYALELANVFHPMYDRVRVFGEGVDEETAKARLRFYAAARVVFQRVLTLMGMSAPEHM